MKNVRKDMSQGFLTAMFGRSGAWCFLAVTINVSVAVWIIVACVVGGPSKEHFGYVTVRPGAHMFWVMYHTEQKGDYTTFPLIMWLQGGPGVSGVGYGNFEELGPIDSSGRHRKWAWTKKANVLFVDSPVGTGYSYVSNTSEFTTDTKEIAQDLITAIKEIFRAVPDMEKMPYYVYAESYGSKMAVDFALAFHEATENGEVRSDFRGVALGNPWISPVDSIITWGSFLYQMGYLNLKGLQKVEAAAQKARVQAENGHWAEAVDEWSNTEEVVMEETRMVNLGNILAKTDQSCTMNDTESFDFSSIPSKLHRLYERHVLSSYLTHDLKGGRHSMALKDLMDERQARHWSIPAEVKWGSQSAQVFTELANDFLKPVNDSVSLLLNETNLQIVIYLGHLDLLCNTLGTYRWIENMDWADKTNFMEASAEPIYIDSYALPAAYVRQSGRLSVYTILRSGRRVATDVPEMALKIIDLMSDLSSGSKKNNSDETIELGNIVYDDGTY